MTSEELIKVERYLRGLFQLPSIRVRGRPRKDDSAEVYIGEEFIGVLFKDEEKAQRKVKKEAVKDEDAVADAEDEIEDIETDDDAVEDEADDTFLEDEEEDGGDMTNIVGGRSGEADET